MIYIVYWIRNENHTNISLEGYVGVTSNLPRRLREHKRNKDNYNVKKNLNQGAIIEIIASGTKEECYQLEQELRPEPYIGWNIIMGGLISNGFKGRTHSEETKQTLRKLYKGKKRGPLSEETKLKIKAKRGGKASHSKLTKEQVDEIKKLLSSSNQRGFISKLARQYNVVRNTIRQIALGNTWK